GLTPDESGESGLELPVDRKGAADEADRARAGTELIERPMAGGHDLGLVAEPQVVVRRENHDLSAPLHPGSRGLRRLQVVEPLVHAVALELLQLGHEPGSQRHAISRMILPASPARIAANAWCRAEGTPDISHTTSAPSPPVSCKTVRTTSSRVALMMTCAPMVRASSRRLGFTSDAMTFAAPAARATPTAKQPIGPHPTMNTVLPDTSAVSTAWKALPSGSITAPTAVGMPFRGSTLVAGMAMYSANAPSRSTPMMRVLRQMCPFPVRHCTQWPHTMWPSAVTGCPTLSSPTPSPTATISPANS